MDKESYYRAKMMDAFFEVTPQKVVVDALLEPLKDVAKIVGASVKEGAGARPRRLQGAGRGLHGDPRRLRHDHAGQLQNILARPNL